MNILSSKQAQSDYLKRQHSLKKPDEAQIFDLIRISFLISWSPEKKTYFIKELLVSSVH